MERDIKMIDGDDSTTVDGSDSVLGLKDTVKIGAAARAAGITVKMVRHYEAVELLPPAIRDETGSRLFTRADIHTLRFIGRGRSLGFSLRAIHKLLSLWQNAQRSNADTLQLAEKHMVDLLRKQSELATMIATLQELIDACAGDGRPECPILDDLAEPLPIQPASAD